MNPFLAERFVKRFPSNSPNFNVRFPKSNEEKKRGGALTFLLILFIISSPILAILSFFSVGILVLAEAPYWSHFFLGILYILNFVFAIFLFKWKKWAFFALLATATMSFVINLVVGENIFSSLERFYGPLIVLFFFIRSKWDLFE